MPFFRFGERRDFFFLDLEVRILIFSGERATFHRVYKVLKHFQVRKTQSGLSAGHTTIPVSLFVLETLVLLDVALMDQGDSRGIDVVDSRGRDLIIDIGNVPAASIPLGRDALYDKERPLNRVMEDGFFSISGSKLIQGDRAITIDTACSNLVVASSVPAEDLPGEKLGGCVNASPLENKVGIDKPKKKSCKKPPKPPRPPKALSLDASDQKLIREIHELAMLKRARIERMKALKKMKNAKTTSSNSNFWAFIVTIFFCLVIFWQGFYSRSSSDLSFEGSPVSSLGTRGGLISVQYFNNVSGEPNALRSASPNVIERVSGFDGEDGQGVARSSR